MGLTVAPGLVKSKVSLVVWALVFETIRLNAKRQKPVCKIPFLNMFFFIDPFWVKIFVFILNKAGFKIISVANNFSLVTFLCPAKRPGLPCSFTHHLI